MRDLMRIDVEAENPAGPEKILQLALNSKLKSNNNSRAISSG